MSPSRPARRRALSLGLVAGLTLLAVVWTALAVRHVFDPLDRRLTAPPVAPLSRWGQILGAVSIVTYPAVTYVGLVAVAWWSWRRRLRNFALACVLAIVAAWGTEAVLKRLIRRPRPASLSADLITMHGWAYPSGHVVAAATVGLMAICVTMATRQRAGTVMLTRVVAIAGVLLVALDRWLLSAHWFSDLIGGFLIGAAVVSACLAVCRVHYLPQPWHARKAAETTSGGTVAAVVYNPLKVGDIATFRTQLEYELRVRGWARPRYYETTPEDAGYGLTRRAVKRNVDLVLAAGGDGTTRQVCSGLAGSGIPVGLVPAGTTNLLARNLGIPFDQGEAIRTALDGVQSSIDLVRIVPDDDDSRATYLDVMGGVGTDAATFAATTENLKSRIGHAAYFVTAAQQITGNPSGMRATLQLDDGEPTSIDASMIIVGNVGGLMGGFEVLPAARPDDGRLDVAVFSQASLAQWLRLVTDVVGRREITGTQEMSAARVRVELEGAVPFELDGDVLGECRVLTATVEPSSLQIMLPPRRAGGGATRVVPPAH